MADEPQFSHLLVGESKVVADIFEIVHRLMIEAASPEQDTAWMKSQIERLIAFAREVHRDCDAKVELALVLRNECEGVRIEASIQYLPDE